MVHQKITLRNDGLDTSMPNDLSMGSVSEYFFQIQMGATASWFKANITSITNAIAVTDSDKQVEDTDLSPEEVIESNCPCGGDWKNHGAYVRCVTKITKKLIADGVISKNEKGKIVSNAARSECGKN
jgi:hypothetical protein